YDALPRRGSQVGREGGGVAFEELELDRLADEVGGQHDHLSARRDGDRRTRREVDAARDIGIAKVGHVGCGGSLRRGGHGEPERRQAKRERGYAPHSEWKLETFHLFLLFVFG